MGRSGAGWGGVGSVTSLPKSHLTEQGPYQLRRGAELPQLTYISQESSRTVQFVQYTEIF